MLRLRRFGIGAFVLALTSGLAARKEVATAKYFAEHFQKLGLKPLGNHSGTAA